jgi:hypothetical protein
MPTLAASSLFGLVALLPHLLVRPPVRGVEMLYERLALRLTVADGAAVGRYGVVWDRWSWSRQTTGLGYDQPDFPCAEYVMRALRAAGYAIATPRVSSPGWIDLVNVDRAVSYLSARGIVAPAPLGRLAVGDVVPMHYRSGARRS